MMDEFTEDYRCPITDHICKYEYKCNFCDAIKEAIAEIRQHGSAADKIKNGQVVEMFYDGQWIRGKVVWRDGYHYAPRLLTMKTSDGRHFQCEIRDTGLYRFVEVNNADSN